MRDAQMLKRNTMQAGTYMHTLAARHTIVVELLINLVALPLVGLHEPLCYKAVLAVLALILQRYIEVSKQPVNLCKEGPCSHLLVSCHLDFGCCPHEIG